MNRVVRSTNVPIAELPSPMIRSPSQCPGTARSSASAGVTLRSRRPPARSRPTPVVLDDGHPADLARQRELFRVLCAIGVDVKRLVRDLYLWQRPDRALLIKERRAHVYEMQAKAGRPLSRVLITGFERYANRLKDQGCALPPRVDNAAFELFNALEASVNAITDRLEGEPPTSASSSHDRTAARYAAERRRLPRISRVHARIAPGARLPAIQQRYMPGVCRAVHHRILAALEAYDGDPLTYRGRRIVRTWVSEAATAPSVDILTAAFVRLVYPLWGASTTARARPESPIAALRPRWTTRRSSPSREPHIPILVPFSILQACSFSASGPAPSPWRWRR